MITLAITGGVVASDGDKKTWYRTQADSILSLYVSNKSPGIQYVVVDKETTLLNHSVGLADIEKGSVLTQHHRMAAFSMTKTLTAIAALQLIEHGLLKLDDRVIQYISHPYSRNLTIQQLINHTSGIPNPIPLRWTHLAHEHDDFDE